MIRCVALLFLLYTGGRATAQSAADQALKGLPQNIKDNGENHVVTKSNNVTNTAMNKIDSASNKALKSVTGIFKKKKKKPAADSTVTHPVDTTAAPKTSSLMIYPASLDKRRQCLLVPDPCPEPFAYYDRRLRNAYFQNTIFS